MPGDQTQSSEGRHWSIDTSLGIPQSLYARKDPMACSLMGPQILDWFSKPVASVHCKICLYIINVLSSNSDNG